MPRYRVLIPWTNDQGTFGPGTDNDTIELSRDTPADEVEVDRLISYGIIEPATETVESEEDTQDEPETAPVRRRSTKK